MCDKVVRVAIQRPIYKLLDYQCRDTLPLRGARVRVPLGSTSVIAIVVEVDVISEFQELKFITEIIDNEPLIDSFLLSLLTWASQYYCYPLGEVLFHALPTALRKSKKLPKVSLWKANELAFSMGENELNRAPKQKEMLVFLKTTECSSNQLLEKFGPSWRNIIRQLDTKKLVTKREVKASYQNKKITQKIPNKVGLTLTDEQDECVAQINVYFKEERPKPILLHGVTGSGKTEVYLRAISAILCAGKQVLVLVPEIGLTPQLLHRFKEHYPQSTIVSLHSGLAEGERLQAWVGARSGEVDIVIGTRSAVFTPMKNLGAVLIDEEHDASFKQQEGFLYHGRDMAIKLAHDLKIPVLLGSATPALESLHNVDLDRYYYLRLASRPGKSTQPEMVVQDIRALPLEAGVSTLMMQEIRQHIDQQHQVMIFLNRRGFAPILMCPACGWHAHCQRCEIGMTYHSSAGKVICHHCGDEKHVKATCPECKSNRLTTSGQGTERVEEVLNTHFPNTPVIRVDRDSTTKKGSLDKKLDEVRSGKPVILIGTQMLTKGHDFPNLTLVGILDIDQALFSMDYRAQERLTQQILQVAGRAGRGEAKGRVVLQTSQPQHPILISLLSQGYLHTAKNIMNERRQWNYPPIGAQALIKVSANNSDAGMNFLLRLSEDIRGQVEVDLLGPMPSPLPKRANRYRFQLLVGSNKRKSLHLGLHGIMNILIGAKKTGGIRWVVDVDPVDFL